MDISKVDTLLQYILAVASENDWEERELGPIHFIKYLYMADLNYASRRQGETYTGIKWQFFRFGPWSNVVHKRIEPSLTEIGAHKRLIHSEKYADFERWSISDSSLIQELENRIETQVALAIKAAVRKYGPCIESLLHDVYKTKPMLYAAPDEYLDFSHAIITSQSKEEPTIQQELTIRQRKKRKTKIDNFKKEFQTKLALKKEKRKKRKATQPTPRYDNIFFEGVETLERLAGEEIPLGKITCSFSDEFWKSKARYDPDLP